MIYICDTQLSGCNIITVCNRLKVYIDGVMGLIGQAG
jgi:hypothetical protein